MVAQIYLFHHRQPDPVGVDADVYRVDDFEGGDVDDGDVVAFVVGDVEAGASGVADGATGPDAGADAFDFEFACRVDDGKAVAFAVGHKGVAAVGGEGDADGHMAGADAGLQAMRGAVHDVDEVVILVGDIDPCAVWANAYAFWATTYWVMSDPFFVTEVKNRIRVGSDVGDIGIPCIGC